MRLLLKKTKTAESQYGLTIDSMFASIEPPNERITPMELTAIAIIAATSAIIVYALYKMIRFFVTDKSANRYEYETVEINGEVVEKVKDRHDDYNDSNE